MSIDNPAEGRSVPIEQVLARYRQQLAEWTERAILAQAQASAAEQECQALRLRVIELEEQVTDDAEG